MQIRQILSLLVLKHSTLLNDVTSLTRNIRRTVMIDLSMARAYFGGVSNVKQIRTMTQGLKQHDDMRDRELIVGKILIDISYE